MTKRTGLKYEHDIANQIHETTDGSIRTYRAGYSGNSKYAQPDVLLTTPERNYALELKRTSQDKGFRIPEEDIRQMYDCMNTYTSSVLAVKFSHRELCVVYWDHASEFDLMAEDTVRLVPNTFNPRVGDKSGALILDKPSLDGPNKWPSAQSGRDDADVILSTIGVGPSENGATSSQTDVNPFEIPTTEGARA